MQVYANGSCGTYGADQGLVNNNCGYTDPYGTFYGSYCNGNALVNTYANGSGGTYDVTQSNCDCGSCGCGCPPPMSDIGVNCFTHLWVCSSNGGYVESNASTTYGNITSHGWTTDSGGNFQPGNGNYDGGKQNYYYTFTGCSDTGDCYTCYATNDTGNYASSYGGCL